MLEIFLKALCYINQHNAKANEQTTYTYRLSFRPRETIYSSCSLRTLTIIKLRNENKHIEITDAKNINPYFRYGLVCLLTACKYTV